MAKAIKQPGGTTVAHQQPAEAALRVGGAVGRGAPGLAQAEGVKAAIAGCRQEGDS